MEEIVELKNNLENFNRIGAIDSSSYAIIMNNLNGLETKLGSDGGSGSEGNSSPGNQESFEDLLNEKLLLEQEKEALADQISNLSRNLRKLEHELESMEKVVLEHKENSEKLLNEKLHLVQEKEALGSQVSTLSRNLKTLEIEFGSMEKVASERKESSDRLLAEKLLMNQEKEFLESRVSSLSRELDLLRNELESTEKVALDHKESSLRLLKEKLFLEQENLLLEQEKVSLIAQAAKLTKENSEFRSRLSVLQRSRPALTPAILLNTFRNSLEEIDRELKKTPSGTKYGIGNMNVSLKTNLAFEGEELRFQIPKADDIIPPENLSTIEFSLGMFPEKPDSPSTSSTSSSNSASSFREVPDLVGLSKREAESILLKAGFKPGEILEKNSSIPQDMVISQLPASGGLAEMGSAVNLVISRILPLKVPDLLGLEIEIAKTVIEMSGLKLGGVREKFSEGKSGLVLSQSFNPGSEAELHSKIILTVSVSSEKGASETDRFDNLKDVSEDASTGVFIETLPNVSMDTSKVSTETPVASSPSKPEPKMKPPIIQRPGFFKSSCADVGTVPPVFGLSLENASEILKAEGIKVGKVSKIVSVASPGAVLHQSPRAGCIANSLIPVDLVVSKEKPKLKPPIIQRPGVLMSPKRDVKKVPCVTGVSFEEAVEVLKQECIKVGNISEIFSRTSVGTVLHQGPKAGCISNPLVPVDLVVSRERPKLKPPIIQRPGFLIFREKDSKNVPPVLGMPFEKAVEILKQEGIKVGKISKIISGDSSGRVLHQSPRAGSIANPIIPIDLAVSKERTKLKPPIIQRPGALNRPKTDVKKNPGVTGVSLEEAVGILKQEGIKVGKISVVVSRISPGTVLNQSPKAGCIANSLIPVDLMVSREAVHEVKTVPRVTGLPFEEAVAVLESEGVNIGKVSSVFSRASPDTVLFQGPKSGSIANSLIPIDLVVSREIIPEVKKVPGVVDMPLAEAVETLEMEGVNVGKITEVSTPMSSGTVLFQSPKSGCIANPIIPVDLVISREIVPEVKTVPMVTNMAFEKAVETLKQEGIKIGRISRIFSRASPDMVLFQSPKSCSIANPIIPVDLVVSREILPEVKKVSRVVDMPFEKAVGVLKKEGVNVGKITEISSRFSPGIVLVQSPKSGSIANPIIPVDLVVSKAPEIEVKKVPRVLGLPVEVAIDVLEREGVNVGRVSRIFSRASPDMVLFQSPKSGSIANPIIPVDLVVSKEFVPEVKKVPRVIDMPFEKAIETLKMEGVKVGKVSCISSKVRPDVVLFQSPKSGCIANPVIPVDLVVSRARKIEVKTVPRVIGLPLDEAIAVLEQEGVKIGKLSVISSRFSPGTVLYQGPRAGCIANPVIPVDLVVSKQPSEPEFSPARKPEVQAELSETSKAEVKEVPMVVNMHLDEAREVLKREGFNVGNILETSSRYSPGTVLSQNPKNGCFAGPELPVDLVVSKKKSRLTLRRLARLRR